MWIRIRAVVVEDEPLAAEYLATLVDDTYQVEVLATATDSETGLQLGFTPLRIWSCDVAPAWTTITAIGTKKGRSLKK